MQSTCRYACYRRRLLLVCPFKYLILCELVGSAVFSRISLSNRTNEEGEGKEGEAKRHAGVRVRS